MGLFDEIQWERKLPLDKVLSKLKIDWKKEMFQTKDFDNFMEHYKVDRRGQLHKNHKEYKWVETPDHKLFGGHLETVSEQWKKSDFTGTVNFYTTVCDVPDEKHYSLWEEVPQEVIDRSVANDYSVDFIAKFVDGKLGECKILKIDIEPIKQQLISHNEWVRSIKIKESKISYKIKRFLRKHLPYNKIINNLNRLVSFQQSLIRKLY